MINYFIIIIFIIILTTNVLFDIIYLRNNIVELWFKLLINLNNINTNF